MRLRFPRLRVSGVGLFLACTVLAWPSLAGAASPGNPTVTWTPTSLSVTLKPGNSTTASVSFKASSALSSVTISSVPGVTSLVTPSPGGLASVAANTVVPVNVAVSIPASTVPGVYTGAIHVMARGKNISKPLPVTINVQGVTSVTTTLSATSITTGASVSDQATITGAARTAAGTITYKVYDNSNCTGTPVADATPSPNTVSNATVPASNSVQFNNAGSFYWQAVYSGDPNTATLGSTSTCTDEKLTVTAPSSCTSHGTFGCPWQNSDLTTYDQGGWDGNPSSVLTNKYSTVYGGGSVIIGGTFGLAFSNAAAVLAYLPASGTARPLTSSLQDPTDTASGVFGGDVLALQLDVDFADAGFLTANSGLKFGDLTICGLTSETGLNGKSVRSFLTIVNALLGGDSSSGFTGADITNLDPITDDLAGSFAAGTPTTWAQQHLENGSCGWHTGDLTTYDELGWDSNPSSILTNYFSTVYGGSSLFIGGTFFLSFTSGAAILAYIPSTGTDGPLTSNMEDPIDTASGGFGGAVVALQVDVDYGDAGVLPATSGLKFGDLTFCGVTTAVDGTDVSALNGMTVRQLLSIDNALLGGATSAGGLTATADEGLTDETEDVAASFEGGTPSSFAQAHLVDGSCP